MTRARSTFSLEDLGWTASMAAAAAPQTEAGLDPGRISAEHTHLYRVLTAGGESVAAVSGRFRHRAEKRSDFPVIGDWVMLRPRAEEHRATIEAVLPRRTCFSRRAAGDETEEQAVAANVDTVFLLAGLDRDFNPRRVERTLVLAFESGAAPVIVLTKVDLCDDVAGRQAEMQAVAQEVPMHLVNAKRGDGVAALQAYLVRGKTVALLGSSGVGKSTLINYLLGFERQRTRAVRESDGRGRHTTTHREMIALPSGAFVVDTPGLRELQLWAEGVGLADTFEDIEALAVGCGFRDCGHQVEPGCAVRAAIADGRLAAERMTSYLKLQRELQVLKARLDPRAAAALKRKDRAIARAARALFPKH